MSDFPDQPEADDVDEPDGPIASEPDRAPAGGPGVSSPSGDSDGAQGPAAGEPAPTDPDDLEH